jgi:hypothetical protein
MMRSFLPQYRANIGLRKKEKASFQKKNDHRRTHGHDNVPASAATA